MNLKKVAIMLNSWFPKQCTAYIKIEEPLDGIVIPWKPWFFKQRFIRWEWAAHPELEAVNQAASL